MLYSCCALACKGERIVTSWADQDPSRSVCVYTGTGSSEQAFLSDISASQVKDPVPQMTAMKLEWSMSSWIFESVGKLERLQELELWVENPGVILQADLVALGQLPALKLLNNLPVRASAGYWEGYQLQYTSLSFLQLAPVSELTMAATAQLLTVTERLEHLRELNLLGCTEDACLFVPAQLSGICALQRLKLHSLRLVGNLMGLATLLHVTRLTLEELSVSGMPTAIPQAVLLMTSLCELVVNRCPFRMDGCSFQHLTLLNRLALFFCSLGAEGDPNAFPQGLSGLVQLDLSHNNLQQLSSNITHLRSLVDLNLSHNGLQQLSSDITQLRSLVELNLSFNQLLSIPHGITRLSRLTRLDMSHQDRSDQRGLGLQFDVSLVAIALMPLLRELCLSQSNSWLVCDPHTFSDESMATHTFTNESLCYLKAAKTALAAVGHKCVINY